MSQLSDLFSQSPLEFFKEFYQQYSCKEYNSFGESLDYFPYVSGVPNLNAKLVDKIGGNEGGGDQVDWVFEFIENGISLGFLRFTGFYDSYNGTEWNETIVEVLPRQVTVTKYFNKE